MNTMVIQQVIAGLVRTFGAPVVTWVAVKLGLAEDMVTTFLVAVVVAGVMWIWSIFDKRKRAEELQMALQLPANSSVNKLKEVLSDIRHGK